MKFALATLVLLATGSAMAYPAVGDRAVFVGTFKDGSGAVQPVNALVEIIGFDSAKNEFTLHSETAIGSGAPQISDQQVGAQKLPTDQMVQSYLTQCLSLGGINGKLTVPAGTFDTCKMPQDSQSEKGFIWIADVPFGAIKEAFETADGNSSDVEMVSFVKGN